MDNYIDSGDNSRIDPAMRAAGFSDYGTNDEAKEVFRVGYNSGAKIAAAGVTKRIEAVMSSTKISGDAQLRGAITLLLTSSMTADQAVDFVVKAHAVAAASQPRAIPTIEERMKGQGALLALGGPILTPFEETKAKPSITSAEGAAEVYARRRASTGTID